MKEDKVLIDADALVALFLIDDFNHEKAVFLAKKIKNSSVYISPFTIPEVATMLSYRISHQLAKIFLKKVHQLKLIRLVFTEKVEKLADEIFLKEKKRKTSWFDCANAAFFKLHRFDKIFSFDKFYQRIGLPVLGDKSTS